jgi:hypothetical protein
MTKGFEEARLNMFLQFISTKHKIPLETPSKTPKLLAGYVPLSPLRRNPTSARSISIRSA